MNKYKLHGTISRLLGYMACALILTGVFFRLITGRPVKDMENAFTWTIAIFFTATVIFEYSLRATIRLSLPDWTEARMWAEIIGKMLSDYAKAKGSHGHYPPSWEELLEINFDSKDKDGFFEKDMIFQKEDFHWDAQYDETCSPPIKFIITVTTPAMFKNKWFAACKKMTYDQDQVVKKYKK